MMDVGEQDDKSLSIYIENPDVLNIPQCTEHIIQGDVPETKPLGTFSQFYQTVSMETMTVRKSSTSVLAVYFQVL